MPDLPSFLRAFGQSWTWRMAWRDSRRSRQRLLVFSTSIVLGIAALTAIGSFGRQLEDAIEDQAKTLLGADFVVASRDAYDAEQEAVLRTIPGERSSEVRFSSMALFLKSQDTRLVQVRALEGAFPFYGTFETMPPSAVDDLRGGRGVVLEETLMTQFDVALGDEVKLGEVIFRVAGSLRKVPGESIAFSTLAPRVYIPLADLPRTKLLGPGSLERHRMYFRLPVETNAERLAKHLQPQAERHRWDLETVAGRKADLGRAMENLYHFLNLVGFIAVLLGGVGIASAMAVHMKQRRGIVAVLRCLGASSHQALAIYVAQGMALGALGALAGAALGLAVQAGLPRVMADFLPMQVEFAIYWAALLRGMAVGFVICLLFALLPLLPMRRIPPLAALRISFETGRRFDALVWLVCALIGAGLIAFSIAQSRRWTHGLGFAAGLIGAFGLLAATAQGVAAAIRGRVPKALPFVWRQGLANIHRPNNRTTLLMLSLGLGTFLILTLDLTQRTLMRELIPSEHRARANTVLFDIQPDQREAVKNLVQAQSLEVLQEAPIITMRLKAVKGRPVEDIRKDPSRSIPRWAIDREYRSTYREEVVDSEKLIAGEWHARWENGVKGAIPVSVETGIAKNLHVNLGDELVFDVQGVPVTTRVASLREVDWRRLQPNFFVVFPRGAIDDAPSFHVFVTRVQTSAQSAQLQRSIVQQFPNVSTIDLTLVLQTVDSVLGKISFVIRFMALFTVGTGLLVLVGAILTGRYQRAQESILLRTLGATRRQVLQILAAEYFALGMLAALTGVLLALAASWSLAHFVFKVNYVFSLVPLLAAVGVVSSLTVVTGLLMSRGILNHPPLEILRAES